MKILVVSQYYYPEDFRINGICEELVKMGNQVTVVTGLPNYPKGVIFKGYEKSYKKTEYVNGVTVIRCNNRPRKKGLFNLLLSYISYAQKAKKVIMALQGGFDVVYAYQMSPVTLVLPAIAYKKRHRVPLYVYVCDIWPESVRDLGGGKQLSKFNPIYLFFRCLSKKIYNSADMIGVKCNEFIDYLNNICRVERKKCFLNYEHAENNYLLVDENPIENGVIDFMYLGNIGHASNCDLIVKAVSRLDSKSFKVHFVGDGSEYDNLVELTRSLKLEDRILFHGKVPQNEIVKYYNLADICLLTLCGKSLIGLTPPAKLTGYMAACRPIVASANGATKRIIEASKCGLVCDADDIDAFAKMMSEIINNPKIIKGLGKNGRDYFLKFFTLKQHCNQLEEHLKLLIKGEI